MDDFSAISSWDRYLTDDRRREGHAYSQKALAEYKARRDREDAENEKATRERGPEGANAMTPKTLTEPRLAVEVHQDRPLKPVQTPDDWDARDVLLKTTKDNVRDLIRLTFRREKEMDSAVYDGWWGDLSMVLAILSQHQCRWCARGTTHLAGEIETCERHKHNVTAADASPTLMQRRQVMRHIFARISDEAWDEAQGTGVFHSLIEALTPKTHVQMGDGCEDDLNVCAICEGGDAHDHDCPVGKLAVML